MLTEEFPDCDPAEVQALSKRFRTIFRLFSRDQPTISSAEAAMVIRAMNLEPTDAEISQLLSQCSDFSSELPSAVEASAFTIAQLEAPVLRAVLTHRWPVSSEEDVQQALSLFDRGGAGYVDGGELLALLRAHGEGLKDEEVAELQLLLSEPTIEVAELASNYGLFAD